MQSPLIGVILISFVGLSGCRSQEGAKDLDVSFGPPGGPALVLDVFRPSQPSGALRPAVILVHGGGWSMGGKEDFRDLGIGLARLGYVTFSVNYRLATETTNHWPAQLDDVQRAVRWIRSQAVRYQIDPRRIGALGASAGGHLVAFLGTTDTRDNSDPLLAAYSSRVSCVVEVSGPVDLTEDFAKKVKSGAAANELIRTFLGGRPADLPAISRDASPLFRADAQSAPFLIVHGKIDELVPVDHAERLHAALRKAGVNSRLVVFETDGHAMGPESSPRFLEEIISFLKTELRP